MVKVMVDVEKKGKSIRAGYHRKNKDNTKPPSAAATFEVGLDYALWTLQRDEKERKAHIGKELNTLDVLQDVEIKLSVTFPNCLAHSSMETVLQAWLLFGGYGARTRRGLGSLMNEDSFLPRGGPSPQRCLNQAWVPSDQASNIANRPVNRGTYVWEIELSPEPCG